MSENRQFVVRVLDVAQGAGALLQVDDQPPRWLSANDTLAVDVPVPSPKADAPERWSGWSDEELDRLGQMLGDGGHELADLQAEVRRRHEADDGLSDAERRAVEVLAAGEWPDHPVHGVWRAGCMVAWLKAAGIALAWKEDE